MSDQAKRAVGRPRGPVKPDPKRNVISFRLTDKQLNLAAIKAGGKERIASYIISQLFNFGGHL